MGWNMARSGKHRARGKWFLSIPAFATAGAVIIALTAGGVVLATTHHRDKPPVVRVTSKHKYLHQHRQPAAITVASVVTGPNPRALAWNTTVTVHFTQPIAVSSPRPIIRPPMPGTWDTVNPLTVEFHPDGNFAPYTHLTVIIPAQVRSSAGAELRHKYVAHFRIAGASILRLQELLGELGYLPLSFTPTPGQVPAPRSGVHAGRAPAFTSPSSPPSGTGDGPSGAPAAPATRDLEPSNPREIPVGPLAGAFGWRFKNIPSWLAAGWAAGQPNVVTTGAVMAFEAAHNMADDGVAGPAVWFNLLKAVAARQLDRAPYDYVYVTEGSPEYVTVWRDGVNVYTTLANTGIPEAPTVQGTWPVYARYDVTTMSGTNPDGSHYADPGIPWVSYFHGGDALHGFLRASYGYPQSLGCVEMPYSSAATVFPYTPIGTLVTVE